jgi:hypothetical protein
VSKHLMLWSGEWVQEQRTRESLERGGDPLEGSSSEAESRPGGGEESSPRVRRSFGGTTLGPSSEAEFHPRGAGADRLMGH